MKTTQRRREDVPFSCSASCTMSAYARLAGVRYHRLFLDADAVIEAYRTGLPLARKLFGPDISYAGPMWNGNSYGHVNCLGAPLTFPEDSEVGHTPVYGSLDDGIRALGREVDFRAAGLFPQYLKLWEKMKRAFPEQKIAFTAFKAEGPVTTGWLLRGHDFFIDIMEDREKAKEYLRLVTESVIRYVHLERTINGDPEMAASGGVADDIAAMVPPTLWPELVVPFLEQYYQKTTSGTRHAHIEDLTVDHLRYLDELMLDSYDPSVSPKLKPELVRDNCRAPFAWRLNSIELKELPLNEVGPWAVKAVAGGASRIFMWIGADLCDEESAEKVQAFVSTGRRIKELLAQGCPRSELPEQVALSEGSTHCGCTKGE